MFAGWPDVDVPAFGIFQAQPGDRSKQRARVPHAREHRSARGVRIEEADFECFCTHGTALFHDSFEGAGSRHLFFDLDKRAAQA